MYSGDECFETVDVGFSRGAVFSSADVDGVHGVEDVACFGVDLLVYSEDGALLPGFKGRLLVSFFCGETRLMELRRRSNRIL
jgi:hypothetical protein